MMGDFRQRVDAAAHRGAGRGPTLPVLAALAVLSLWALAYELADAALPSIGHMLLFQGIAPDIAFIAAGLLLLVRGLMRERVWVLFAAGALCWAAGDIYWTVHLAHLSSPPVPSWADAGYLLFCPFTVAGIVGLMRRRVRNAPKTLIADALAAALAVGGLSAALVVQPVLAHASGGTLSVATNLAYPLVDLVLLGLIVGAVAVGGWRLQRLWVLLGASVLAFWVADSFYLVTVATNTYHLGAWFNPLWYASPIVAAWAAWLAPRASEQQALRPAGKRGIVLPLAFACLALGTLVRSSFSSVGVIAIVLCTLSLLVIMVRLALTWRENASLLRVSREEALTDSLTGLGNRRALTLELEQRLQSPGARPGYVLALFDLDGFKSYNDTFGHPAGDVLLQRLGATLRSRLLGRGSAYRMGGDEFCVLIDERPESLQLAVAALAEHGEGFTIGCSYGSVRLTAEAGDVATALRIADQRMYAHKQSSRMSASRQSGDVLLRALAERDPELSSHVHDVADLAAATAERFGLRPHEVVHIRQAAELHDVGKVAIPDAILDKRGRLTAEEREFIRRHTLIGERILLGAPALHQVARLVRSSHENFDGSGYPDGLSGQEIPLGSRIIAVCDAFHAMITDRPYRAAMSDESAVAELRRCAGSQFDPAVVEHVCQALAVRERLAEAA